MRFRNGRPRASRSLDPSVSLIRLRGEQNGKCGQSLLILGLAIVIRCLPRPSNELRRAMETLNRYIDGGRKRDQTTDLRGMENS